jgi:hypothetical protein
MIKAIDVAKQSEETLASILSPAMHFLKTLKRILNNYIPYVFMLACLRLPMDVKPFWRKMF